MKISIERKVDTNSTKWDLINPMRYSCTGAFDLATVVVQSIHECTPTKPDSTTSTIFSFQITSVTTKKVNGIYFTSSSDNGLSTRVQEMNDKFARHPGKIATDNKIDRGRFEFYKPIEKVHTLDNLNGRVIKMQLLLALFIYNV